MSQSAPPSTRRWPLFLALRGVGAKGFGRDLVAGLTLAAVAAPGQMATARLGGFAPQLGLIAFVGAAVAFAAFGANRRLSVGADSTITPIFAGSLGAMALAGSAQYGVLATVLALMVGLLLIAAGVFRLGWIADLLSTPVISGFLAGIAAHIVLSQAPTLMGVPEAHGNVLRQVQGLWAERGAINPIAATVGLGTFAVILVTEKITPRFPGALLALVGATAATAAFDLDGRGLRVLGRLGALPQPHWPHLALTGVPPLVGLAFVIALLVMVQTGATTRAFNNGEPDINRDFVGVGVASLAAGVLGAFPVNASPPSTGVVAESGGGSQWASLTAAIIVLAVAAFGGGLLARAPAAALAGVLLFVALQIVHVRTFAAILRRTGAEFALALLTTALIVALPIQTGVAIGIFLSLAHGVFTTTRAQPIVFERVAGTTVWWPVARGKPDGGQPAEILVMGFQAPLSFLNAYDFRRGVLQAIGQGGEDLRLFVLEAGSIVEIDFTAAMVLDEVIDTVRATGVQFAIARLESVRAQLAFERFGLTEKLGRDHLFHSVAQAIDALAPTEAGGRPTSASAPQP